MTNLIARMSQMLIYYRIIKGLLVIIFEIVKRYS